MNTNFVGPAAERRGGAERAILTELLRSRPASRKRISETSGFSTATVSRAIDQLIADGLVREGQEVVSESRGRRAVLLDLESERSYVVGLDLGASNLRLIVADLVGTPVHSAELPTPSELDPPRMARYLAGLIRSGCGPFWPRVDAICLGLPAAISRVDGSVFNANNLAQVEDPAFVTTLEHELGHGVQLHNDADLALLGELRFGAARAASTAAMLTFGAGLGAGLARDGILLQGPNGIVGEFGQLPVGPLGTRLEHMVTGPGILRRASEAGIEMTSPAELFAEEAAPAAAAMRAQFDQALLIALTAITVACEPEVVVLGGGIAKSLASSLDRYRAAIERHLRYAPRLAHPELGDYSGAAGAVVAALREVYRTLGVAEADLGELPAPGALDAESIRRVGAEPAPEEPAAGA